MSPNSTSPIVRRYRIRFALLGVRSPLLTQSLLISFPLPTQMFQFGRFLLTNVSVAERQDVPLGNLRIKGSLRLHGIISRLGTTFFSTRAEQSAKWFKLIWLNLRPGCVCNPSNLMVTIIGNFCNYLLKVTCLRSYYPIPARIG